MKLEDKLDKIYNEHLDFFENTSRTGIKKGSKITDYIHREFDETGKTTSISIDDTDLLPNEIKAKIVDAFN